MLAKDINLNSPLINENLYIFTIDTDWASESAIKYCLDYFESNKIPLTVFLTHNSPFLEAKKTDKLYSFGIHPNFVPDSSQGSTYSEVIDFCMKLLPETRFYRAHRYYDVNDTVHMLRDRGFLFDSNLCTLLQDVRPFIHRSGLMRFPVYFEDGAYLENELDLNFCNVKKRYFDKPGIKVINIHPMHMVINTPINSLYRHLADTYSRSTWNNLNEDHFKTIKHRGLGIENFIYEMVAYVKKKNYTMIKLEDAYKELISIS